MSNSAVNAAYATSYLYGVCPSDLSAKIIVHEQKDWKPKQMFEDHKQHIATDKRLAYFQQFS